MNSDAEIRMSIGVCLRTRIVDPQGAPTEVIITGGALRAEAVNLGVISFYAQMSTVVIGDAVTDSNDAREWAVEFLIPASARGETEGHEDTRLKVTRADTIGAFRTVGALFQLSEVVRIKDNSALYAPGRYESKPLDIYGTTA